MSTVVDKVRLRRLLDRPELQWLVMAARRRLENGGGDRITTGNLTESERAAVEGLLGRRPGRGQRIVLSLQEVEMVLRNAGAAPDLRTALEVLGGPLIDRRAERAAEQQHWESVWRQAEARAGARLLPWVDELRRSGLLRRLSGRDPDAAEQLLRNAFLVLDRLPAGGQTLSTLAATSVGDAHALDANRPLTTLVKKAVLHMGGAGESPLEEEGDRSLWASVGILPGGAITSTVLVLNLPAEGEGATAVALQQFREEGQPVWLTLRQLLRDPPRWSCRRQTVHICENPAVLAEAADTLGSRSGALVCTNGQPVAAVMTLLRQLKHTGAELFYHGDFDWPGIAIGNRIIGYLGAAPWRFDASSYRKAVASHACRPLIGRVETPTWDVQLGEAMVALNRQVHEEQVLEVLLNDLQESD